MTSIAPARFLARFAGKWPWAHIDIAGGQYYAGGPDDTPRSYLTPGATGAPLRALVAFLRGQVG